MMLFGAGLYLIFLVLILWFVKCARGKSLGDLFEDNDHHHHQILRMIEKISEGRYLVATPILDGRGS